MKRISVIAAFLIVTVFSAQARKIGFINTDSVLVSIPDYTKAQESLKAQASLFQQDLEKDLQYIDNLYTKYQEQKQYLNAASCNAREQQIISLETALKEKQEKYFGAEGEMTKRSEALLAPIKQRVNGVVSEYSKANGYSAILDLAITPGLIYYDESEDITRIIIDKLK